MIHGDDNDSLNYKISKLFLYYISQDTLNILIHRNQDRNAFC